MKSLTKKTQPDLHILMVANQPTRTGKYKIRCRAEKWLRAQGGFEFHKTIPSLILHNIDYDKEAKAKSGYTGPDRYVPYTILFKGKRSEAERFAGGLQMFYIGSNCVHADDGELPVVIKEIGQSASTFADSNLNRSKPQSEDDLLEAFIESLAKLKASRGEKLLTRQEISKTCTYHTGDGFKISNLMEKVAEKNGYKLTYTSLATDGRRLNFAIVLEEGNV